MKKLSLKSLKVQSFITELNNSNGRTIKGGNTENYESVIICEEPAETVGCPAETFAVDIFGC